MQSWAVELRRLAGPAAIIVTLSLSTAATLAAGLYIFFGTELTTLSKTVYFAFFFCLFYCALAYQVNRLGAALRGAARGTAQRPAARLFTAAAPRVSVLVPSYCEEPRVLQMTVLSAALAQYGNRNVVVLVDDPPHSEALPTSLATIEGVRACLAEPMAFLRAEAQNFARRQAAGAADPAGETPRIAALYDFAADWLDQFADGLEGEVSADFAHVDCFFIDEVVRELAATYRRRGRAVAATALTARQVGAEYQRLAALFCDDITAFQRKSFANLSHAANKAMNLNSYIGLMGGRYRITEAGGKRYLDAAGADEAAALEIGRADYLLTLDADSMIRSSYLAELVGLAEAMPQAGVVQTPYLTFPSAASPVERIAGATTDIQYLVHQGSTRFRASYWVGANALLRMDALEDICEVRLEPEGPQRLYVQDRTVIEDTGSTLDLLDHGWIVHNHFKPLAYSSTPADFGSLAIQRQRWSNGGLIIFPALWRQYRRSGRPLAALPELLLRAHYLLSPLIGNVAVLALMVLILANSRNLIVTPLAMLPYFLLYGIDLARIGYRFRDLFAVCSLNLMLLPVSLAGVVASLAQLITGRKAAFARTPKIAGRTGVHPVYILFNLGMFVLMAGYTLDGILSGEVIATIVPATNVALYGYGLARFIGPWHGLLDLALPAGRGLAAFGRATASVLFDGWRGPLTPRRVLRFVSASLVGIVAILVPVSFDTSSMAKSIAGTIAADAAAPLPTPARAAPRLHVRSPAAGDPSP